MYAVLRIVNQSYTLLLYFLQHYYNKYNECSSKNYFIRNMIIPVMKIEKKKVTL